MPSASAIVEISTAAQEVDLAGPAIEIDLLGMLMPKDVSLVDAVMGVPGVVAFSAVPMTEPAETVPVPSRFDAVAATPLLVIAAVVMLALVE